MRETYHLRDVTEAFSPVAAVNYTLWLYNGAEYVILMWTVLYQSQFAKNSQVNIYITPIKLPLTYQTQEYICSLFILLVN